ncbi:MAG: transcription termination/antitermination NusG family protein [Xanthobacteraceae bacterium]|jgi:transcriptional antiterminator NusG
MTAEHASIATPPSLQWYAVRLTRGECHTRERLERADLQFYYPLVSKLRPVPKRKLTDSRRNGPTRYERKVTPFFRDYFFVRFNLDGWPEVLRKAGLKGILGQEIGEARLPASIAEAAIAELMAREVDGAIPEKEPMQTFKPGNQVTIHAALPVEVDATVIENLDASAKLKVLVAMFGRQTVVELPLEGVSQRMAA